MLINSTREYISGNKPKSIQLCVPLPVKVWEEDTYLFESACHSADVALQCLSFLSYGLKGLGDVESLTVQMCLIRRFHGITVACKEGQGINRTHMD